MSEINVISRDQHIIVDVPTKTVNVLAGEAEQKDLTVGVPVVSGASYRGTVNTTCGGGTGNNIILDPTNGLVQKIGTDVELVNAGANTCEFKVNVDGLYHVSAYARIDGTAPFQGSLLMVRQTTIGAALARQTFVSVGYAAVTIGFTTYLTRDQKLAMVGYCPSGTMIIATSAQNSIDPYSPIMSVWRVSTVQLVA